MADNVDRSPIGQEIEHFIVLGKEWDGHNAWVAADMRVEVKSLGGYFLRVVTKDKFANEQIQETAADIDGLEPEGFNTEALERRSPFVLNHSVITDEVLHDTFDHRVIGPDLAPSLWPSGEQEL